MVRVLFVSAVSDLRGGAEQVLLDMLANPAIEPILALPGPGPLEEIAGRHRTPIVYYRPASLTGVHRPMKILPALRSIPDAFRCAARLRQLAREHGCDIIHSNGLKVHVLAALASFGQRRFASVVHLHDIAYSTSERLLWRAVGRLVDRVVVVSPPCWPGKSLPANVRVIPNGISVQATAGTTAHQPEVEGAARPTFQLGFVGRFHPHKGLLLLVDWLARARDAGLDFQTRLRGGAEPHMPEYWLEVQQRIAARKLQDRVQVDGWRTGDATYAGLDALVVPSDRPDPLPRVVLEAGARCLPVIAMRSGGIPTMIVDEKTGFLVDDAQGFITVLGRLIRDADLRRAVGSAAQRHIVAEFTLRRFYERFDALYAEIVPVKPGTATVA